MSSADAHIQLVNALVANDHMWEATMDALPDAVYIFSSDKRLKKINHAGEALERAARGFLTSRNCCEMFWGLKGSDCIVDRAVSNRTAVKVEIPAGHKVSHPLLVHVVPMSKQRQHLSGTACIVIARDVSELRDVEEKAGKQRAFLASLADLAPDEIYTLDSQCRFTWMNRRAEVDSGLTSSVMLGQEFSMVVAAESKDEVKATLQCTLGGEEKQFEMRTICADGRVRCMEAHTTPLWREGSVTGAMVFMSDITERKLAQERAARSDKLRALGELAAGVAHNLNNSLTVIQGRAQLLSMRSTDGSQKKSLEVITQAVADCSQTLRRLLDFSRRDATRASAPVDLSELITSSVEIARPKWQAEAAHRTGVIEVRVDAPGPVMTLGDSSELREVVLNLIFNAVDAMPRGGTIGIGTRIENQTARFWVADTGTGMGSEVIARIFEPFYSTKGERGTGLGLSASHGIIESHGGDINVTSELGKGTRFEVILPLHESSSPLAVATAAAPSSGSKPARVLVVEDEEEVRTLLKDAFRAGGHNVTEASTGAEAIEKLDQNEFDLIVCDLGLPELSGLHVARWVKEFRPHLPVIIATGYAEMIAEEDYDRARIDDVIRKPYAVADVLARANRVLEAQANTSHETVLV